MDAILDKLSRKELAVLALLSKGYSNAKIAGTLDCKVSTIIQNLNRIYSELQNHADFDGRNKRVAAARIYLMATNQLSNQVAT